MKEVLESEITENKTNTIPLKTNILTWSRKLKVQVRKPMIHAVLKQVVSSNYTSTEVLIESLSLFVEFQKL
jgi:hypothetical protein